MLNQLGLENFCSTAGSLDLQCLQGRLPRVDAPDLNKVGHDTSLYRCAFIVRLIRAPSPRVLSVENDPFLALARLQFKAQFRTPREPKSHRSRSDSRKSHNKISDNDFKDDANRRNTRSKTEPQKIRNKGPDEMEQTNCDSERFIGRIPLEDLSATLSKTIAQNSRHDVKPPRLEPSENPRLKVQGAFLSRHPRVSVHTPPSAWDLTEGVCIDPREVRSINPAGGESTYRGFCRSSIWKVLRRSGPATDRSQIQVLDDLLEILPAMGLVLLLTQQKSGVVGRHHRGPLPIVETTP